ncbi:MAG: hypothetical protein V2A64_02190 [Candidatus Omnitrophota bacterium]
MRERRKFDRIMINVLVIFLASFALALTIGSQTTARWLVALAQTGETLTITTYYPSPLGSYLELRSRRMAIGPTWFDANVHCWAGGPCGAPDINANADLIVERRVGIGTLAPSYALSFPAGVFTSIGMNDAAAGASGQDLLIKASAGNGAGQTSGNIAFYAGRGNNTASDGNIYLGKRNDAMGGFNIVTLRGSDGNFGLWASIPEAEFHLAGYDNTPTLLIKPNSMGAGDTATIRFEDPTVGTSAMEIRYKDDGSADLAIMGGNLGVDIADPTAKLHVNGNIKAVLNPVAGAPMDYAAGSDEIGTDIAEISETNEDVEIGDVLVIAKNGKFEKSNQAYDSKVAGIVSAAPAIVFEGSQLQIAPQPFEFKKGRKPPLALAGRVKCKVTADEGGSIKIGDLLVTSSKPGYAMKADAEKVRVGQVLGKALGALDKGEGEITVLAALQ